MKIGITASAFDLLHAGHVLMLEECKEHCDYLIACLQVDPTLDRPEKNKPIQTVFERYTQLRAVKWVDEIIPYASEQELVDILKARQPTIRFVGEEYRDKDFTGKEIGDIQIFYNSRRHRFSSSELRKRMVDENREMMKKFVFAS